MTKILHIDSSSAATNSTSRKLSKAIVAQVGGANADVTYRDLATSKLEVLTEAQIGSFYTAPDERSDEQKEIIKTSDVLVAELQAADIIVIGMPMYNFSVPASFKLYQDLVARAGVTYNYTEQGPVGLLENKKVYIARSAGGVATNSDGDNLSAALSQYLNFLGLSDVTTISADRMAFDGENSMGEATQQVEKLVA